MLTAGFSHMPFRSLESKAWKACILQAEPKVCLFKGKQLVSSLLVGTLGLLVYSFLIHEVESLLWSWLSNPNRPV